MKNLVTRSLAGIVYVAIILAAIFIKDGIYLLGFLFALLAGMEFTNLCCGKAENNTQLFGKYLTVIATIGAYSLVATPFVVLHAKYETLLVSSVVSDLFPVLALFGCVAAALRFLLTIYDSREGALRRMAFSAMSWVYLGLPLGCMAIVSDLSLGSDAVLMLFIMIWLNDTGAYCVGSLCGRRKLFERLSPKKSWEGFWGGMVFSIIAGVVYALISFSNYDGSYLHGIVTSSALSQTGYIAAWAFIGAAISAAATWGDLFESLIKRTLGVKDSGHLIPGHGGILDRIDSLLFAAPAMFLLCICFFG